MKPQVVATVVLTSLITTLPAAADHRAKKKPVVAEKDETEEDDTKAQPDPDGPEAKKALTVKLDDLIEVAVRLSPTLARSKNDRFAAHGDMEAAKLAGEPTLLSKVQVDRMSIGAGVDVGPFQVVAQDNLTASLGMSKGLGTGGNVTFELGIQRSLKEYEIPVGLAGGISNDLLAKAQAAGLDTGSNITDTSVVDQAYAQLNFKQPLARGFKGKGEFKKAGMTYAAATIKTQYDAEVLIRDTVKAYWDLAYSAYEVGVRTDALALAKRQEEITRAEFRATRKPQSEIDAAIFEVATREEALLTAKNNYEKVSLDVRKQIGIELDRRDIVLKPADAFEIDNAEWDLEEVLKAAHAGNRQIASLILQKRAAEVDVKTAENGMLPKIDLELSGKLFGSGSTPDQSFTATASPNAGGFQVMGSLTFQWEIGGAAKGAYDAARARRQAVEIDQADAQRQIDTDVIHAVHEVKAAQARVALTDTAIRVAEENVKAEKSKYMAGVAGSENFRITQRMNDLIEARLRRGKAVADYHTAVAQVQFLGGMLLEQYRIDVRPLPKHTGQE